ncbi:MAG: hypothetical protein JXR77_08590 [Lentisphaeria bacterium]|nr:hypothetical protein [Lentisphaeria bacterium]
MKPLQRLGSLAAVLMLPGLWVRSAATPSPFPRVDVDRCGGEPPGEVSVRATAAELTFRVRPSGANSHLHVAFREPLSTAGMDRLVLEGRSLESSGEGAVVARLTFVSADGKTTAVYEPDLRFPPEWNRRTILLGDVANPVPQRIGAIHTTLWTPHEIDREFEIALRRCEFLSAAQAAAELTPVPCSRRPVPPNRERDIAPGDRRWRSFGPGGGGWYRVVAISPHDGTCLVGGDVGGMYRSRDGCRSWEMVNDGIPNLYVNCITFHPTRPETVFAGSNGGVLKSIDGGSTWAVQRHGFPPLLTFGLSAPISAVAVDARRPDVVYAGIGREREYGALDSTTLGGRIYRSEDGGETWTGADLPGGDAVRGLSVLSLLPHPDDPDHIYATTPKGLYHSGDAGRSWQRLGSGLDGYLTTFLTVARKAPDTMLLAYCRGPDGSGGVLRSRDGGSTWTPSNEGLPRATDAWRLLAHPLDSSTFFVGWHRRAGLFVSRDAGDTWHPANPETSIRSAWFFRGVNVTGLAIDPRDPRRLVTCNDMDLYQTLDGGESWEQVATELVRPATADHPAAWRGRGCEILCAGGPQALAVDPTDPRQIFFGYWDTHAWKSEDGGKTCFRLTDGIDSGYGRMGCVVLDPANPDVVYLSKGKNYDEHRLYRSVDGGGRFHLVGHAGGGLPPGGVFCLCIDPRSPGHRRVLLAAVTGYGVYRSEDGGLTWTERSRGLPGDSRMPLQIVMDPGNPDRFFLASGAHYHRDTRRRVPGYIARTLDAGATWDVVKAGIEPQCILLDPFDPARVYAGNRNFSGIDYPNAFYRSEDGGDRWSALDQEPFLGGPGSAAGDQGVRVIVSALAADPTVPGRLYAACRDEAYDVSNGRGVFRSPDHGRTWEPFPLDGLANFRVATFIVDPADPRRLYAGTGGNGFFRFGPPPEPGPRR